MPNTTTSTNTIQEFAPEFKPLASLVGGAAEAQLGRAYTPYGGVRTAGFTPTQQVVQTGITGLAAPTQLTAAQQALTGAGTTITGLGPQTGYATAQKELESARNTLTGLGTPTDYETARQAFTGAQGSIAAPGALTGYVNPFNANVTDIAARQMARDFAAQQTQRGADFARSGAFGGSRQAVTEAEALRNLNQQLQDLQFKGNAAAYQAAIDQFNKERAQQMTAGQQLSSLGQAQEQSALARVQAQGALGGQFATLGQQQQADALARAQAQAGLGSQLANLGQTQQQLDLERLQAQSGVGQQQQALTQQQLDLAYQNFLDQRDWAKQQTGWASGILQGIPSGVGQTYAAKTEAVPGGNPWAQAAGAGATLYGLGKTFNWWD